MLVFRFLLIVGDPIYCDIEDPTVRLGQSGLFVFRFQLIVGDPVYFDIGDPMVRLG